MKDTSLFRFRYSIFLLSIILISCNSFDTAVINDPKYSGGVEYGTGKPISPNVFKFDEYTFVSGFSDKGGTVGAYYGDKEIFFRQSQDGFYDTVMLVNLNNDNIPDFLIENMYEDGSVIYALISQSRKHFIEELVTDNYGEVYCLEGGDTLQYLQPLLIQDINEDNQPEILINHAKMKDKLFSISCSDTFWVNR